MNPVGTTGSAGPALTAVLRGVTGIAVLRGVTGIAARQELILVAIIIMTVLMMVLPMPTVMADGLIALDIGMALILVLLSLYVRAATELSTLPSLILVTTAFRLSISITTSRLVLVQGDAGAIIRTFGEFVIAGNVVVGLVVYLIITVVQFVVITKGSERVAEVAARFNLDALPGKQMSIDTDVRNGDLSQADARRRRSQLERESHLYGAMDGAMKFVKGDAIASLVIIAVNLVGGIAIGCLQRGMPFSRAVQTYSLLAVGDGLIAQVPALLVSLTAGLVVTRAVAEEGANLSEDIVRQVTAYARPMQIAGAVLAGFSLVPGFPAALFCGIGAVLAGGGFLVGRVQSRKAAEDFAASARQAELAPEAARLTVIIGPGLQDRMGPIKAALVGLRAEIAADLGIAIPKLRLQWDSALGSAGVKVLVDGVVRSSAEGLDETALVEHVRRTVLRCAGGFVGIQETQAIIARVEGDFGELVREALKAAALPRLAEIIRHLVDEEVPVRNMRSVLEAIAGCGPRDGPASGVADQIRVVLRRQVCLRWADPDNALHILVLDGSLEAGMRDAAKAHPADPVARLDPAAADNLLEEIRGHQRSALAGAPVLVLAGSDVRRLIQATLARRGLDVPVLCHAELAAEFVIRVVGSIGRTPVEAGRSAPVGSVAGPRPAGAPTGIRAA